MQIHNVKQGTEEWLHLRSNYFTASEAPAICNDSKYQTRTELLNIKKTGVTPDVDDYTQKLFDKGHQAEAMIRPVIEKFINDELYPVTGSVEIDGLPLLASFDGINFDETIIFECKLWNQSLVEAVENKDLPAHYYWQLEQQILVANAEKAIFVVTDGSEENMRYMEYYSIPERREKLLANIKQFAKDLETFEPAINEAKPTAKVIDSLPIPVINITGEVTNSNLSNFKEIAFERIDSIKTDLVTQQDFVDAEATVKFLADGEKKLENAKTQALAETASIEEVFRTIDDIKEKMRTVRLDLNKQVKNQKETRKLSMVQEANAKLAEHINSINNELKEVMLPPININFANVIKGKSNFDNMQNDIDAELASAKIEADRIASIIRNNLTHLSYESQYRFLFSDLQQIITKDKDDFVNLVTARIEQHKQAERERLEKEREQIRLEEERKLKAQAERERLEQERKQKEEQQKLEAKEKASQELNKRLHEESIKSTIEAKKEIRESISNVSKEQLDQAEQIKSFEQESETITQAVYSWLKGMGVEKGIAYRISTEIKEGRAPYLTMVY